MPYLSSQLITCIGNKRKLLPFIEQGIKLVLERIGGGRNRKLRCFDAFAGSGAVSRLLKGYASELYSNDLEAYATALGRCYLANASELPPLKPMHAELLARLRQDWAPGFITELYAPDNDACIAPGERAFYTRRNAIYLDSARRAIADLPPEMQPFFLGPLLYEASVHTNTGGVFKGFYKDARGVGSFGGRGKHALERITADIHLPLPVFSRSECPCHVMQADATHAAQNLPELDLAYLDPPYNQHPYGSNYFMLNLLTHYERPERVSTVSGIPADWNRSAYNRRAHAATALQELLEALPSRFALLSYNSEGLLSEQQILSIAQCAAWSPLSILRQDYAAFRASRNLASRALKVQEYLFVFARQ